ncbi:hypothetical protein Ae168Ps1_4568c [Pseudonocardia sp. Ae168_Ps1]|nr:hypothetical protein Ae168Ps1_4568c [Pseudonocardia sp. Ae168_Ps1]OLL83724.1 hypothetical protein Ae263Ps1_0779 [Pseudonocardia sp. Ae263_Ps1]
MHVWSPVRVDPSRRTRRRRSRHSVSPLEAARSSRRRTVARGGRSGLTSTLTRSWPASTRSTDTGTGEPVTVEHAA